MVLPGTRSLDARADRRGRFTRRAPINSARVSRGTNSDVDAVEQRAHCAAVGTGIRSAGRGIGVGHRRRTARQGSSGHQREALEVDYACCAQPRPGRPRAVAEVPDGVASEPVNSSRNRTPLCASETRRGEPGRIAPEARATPWCGTERPGRDEPSLSTPATSADGDSSASWRLSAGRPWKPPRQHRLPAPAADQQHIVAAGCRVISRACATACPRTSERSSRSVRTRLAAQPRAMLAIIRMPRPGETDHRRQRRGGHDPQALHQLGFRWLRDRHPLQPRVGGRHGYGEHARSRDPIALQRQLTAEGVPVQPLARHLRGRGQHSERERQVEARALLAHVGRRQVHHDASKRPRQPRGLHRGTHPFASVLHAGARQPRRDRLSGLGHSEALRPVLHEAPGRNRARPRNRSPDR